MIFKIFSSILKNNRKQTLMNNLVIIGASELQLPLIKRANELGYSTYVFAWKDGAVGLDIMTKFYDIDIKEVDKIYDIAKELHPVGVCSIASDLANITVQKLASRLNLPHNSAHCLKVSTNKYAMRKELFKHNILCPKFLITDSENVDVRDMKLPIIVKPTDRSGSRAITKVNNILELPNAIRKACDISFEKKAIVEEFIGGGNEYSAECISQNGKHYLLNITKKFTTGSPHFIETGHLEPAGLDAEDLEKIKDTVFRALYALDIKIGASHCEFKFDHTDKVVHIIEIGSRMGGDFIGSSLVGFSTGYDFLKMVIDCAVGNDILVKKILSPVYPYVCVKYCFDYDDIKLIESIDSKNIIDRHINKLDNYEFKNVLDSSTRYGYAIMHFDKKEEALEVLNK